MKKASVTRKKTANASVSIDRDLLHWLDAQATARRLTRSRFLNELIAEAMFADKVENPDSVTTAKKLSSSG